MQIYKIMRHALISYLLLVLVLSVTLIKKIHVNMDLKTLRKLRNLNVIINFSNKLSSLFYEQDSHIADIFS